jgi:hypothetical protein
MLIILFDIKGMFTNNSFWQAKQSVLRMTVMFYGNCMKMCEDLTPNFGDKRTGYCIMTTRPLTLPFSTENF